MNLEVLNIKAPLSSKTSKDSYPATMRYIQDDRNQWWEPVWKNYNFTTELYRFNPLALNDIYIYIYIYIYIRRNAQLTSRRCILNIYSTNILTEYFKHAVHSPFFFSKCRLFHIAAIFGSYNTHILNTGCAKILKKIQAPMN